MPGACARSMCQQVNATNETDVLTLDALPLAMAMTHSVTRAAKRINDEPEA